MSALDDAARVLFLHAHPDDETLATGALIADLVARGVEVAVVTATRGEQGELTDPRLTDDLVALRESELAGALAVLGVPHHAFLGTPPARATGLPPRHYTDSGMAWVTPDLAGPGPDAGPDSLSAAELSEPAADLVAYAHRYRPDVLVSYQADGGYGHPDHVACHRIAAAAAERAGVRFVEVVSHPPSGPGPLDGYRDLVAEALRRYRSQLWIDEGEVVHVGGQRHPIPTSGDVRDAGPRGGVHG